LHRERIARAILQADRGARGRIALFETEAKSEG
jgi:hypothetical protein